MEIKKHTYRGKTFYELEDGFAFYSRNGDLIGGYRSLDGAFDASFGWQ